MANWLSFGGGKFNSRQVLCFNLTNKKQARNLFSGGKNVLLAALLAIRVYFWAFFEKNLNTREKLEAS